MTESLTLQRTLRRPPVDVWEAWTTARGLESWWWKHWPGVRATVDLQVGGAWRIEASEQGIAVGGTYTRIDEPTRLEKSWVWSDDDGDGPTEHVVVTFEPTEEGTVLTVVHTGMSDAEAAENYRQGWDFTLDQLAQTCA